MTFESINIKAYIILIQNFIILLYKSSVDTALTILDYYFCNNLDLIAIKILHLR